MLELKDNGARKRLDDIDVALRQLRADMDAKMVLLNAQHSAVAADNKRLEERNNHLQEENGQLMEESEQLVKEQHMKELADKSVQARVDYAEQMENAMMEGMTMLQAGKKPQEILATLAPKYPKVAAKLGKKFLGL